MGKTKRSRSTKSNKRSNSNESSKEIVVFGSDRKEDSEGATRGLKPLPDLMKQGVYETQDQFIKRLNRMVNKAIGEATIEDKFDVDLCPPASGARASECNRTKRSINKIEKRKKHVQKRKVKAKQRKQLKNDDFDGFKEKITFGETTHAPPNMDDIRRKFDAQIKKMNAKKARLTPL